MAQQTAVEWLEEKFNKWAEGKKFILHDYFEIAKQMEKKQIMTAYINGELQQGFEAEAEQYYNETYGKGDNL
jgi:membrane carboxypeptidase/penicillin-binding protein PbpC